MYTYINIDIFIYIKSLLQKRVLRLQQIKQKEAMNKEQQREQEIRREQELIGRSTN